jgi:signal transduction histidine kinase
MFDQLFNRLRDRYITAILLGTRLCGSLGGVLVVYYVNLTLTLEEPMRSHFIVAAGIVVLLALALSLLCASLETRNLRAVLKKLAAGEVPDPAQAAKAGREAVLFPVRHHRNEAWLVPCTTLLPVVIFLRLAHHAPAEVLGNIALAVFMGIGLALMSTFLIIERSVQPVVRHLMDHGVQIDFEHLPTNKLLLRLNLCFGLIILITALMIGTLANQRAADIIHKPDNQNQAVADLRNHTMYITITAIIVGLVFATTISQSVASRVARLVLAMKRVERGSFNEELRATGHDEIDELTRQFNSMVQQLAQNDTTIRDLNVNLERKVDDRTLSLRLLHAELDERNNELESALAELTQAQSQLLDVAHRAGMTEIATGVLHNVGNVLNSVNVSVTVLADNIRKSKVSSILKVAQLLEEHAAALEALGAEGDKLRKLPDYLKRLADTLSQDQQEMLGETRNLAEKVQHIKNIISAQQSYTRRVSFKEEVDLELLINDLLAMHEPSIVKNRVRVIREIEKLPALNIEKSKLLQVLDNLVKNALESMLSQSGPRDLTLTAGAKDGAVLISVKDTGHGIADEHTKNIFRFGFTTKVDGNGFGLHSSALAMSEMGGGIRMHSDGVGQGATFTITLPLSADASRGSAGHRQPAMAEG